MARARWTALAVAALMALVIGTAGCGSSDEQGTDVSKVAFVAPFADNEPDWTLQAREVVADWPSKRNVRVDVVDASKTDDLDGAFEQVAHEGNQLVIAHDSRYAEAAEAAARRADVRTLVWGERPDAPRGLVGQIHVQDKEGGYVAGLIAAHSAYTRRLGVIVMADGSDWDTATWNRMAGGYIAGARSNDPNVEIRYEQVGTDGKATAKQVYDTAIRMQKEGTQMLFALGGAATIGALRAVETIKGEDQYVGVIGDKAEFNRENYVLESVMYDTRPVFEAALRDVRTGRFAERPYALTLRNHGVWLFQTGRTPGDAYEAGMAAQRKIERGQIDIPSTPTSEDVRALLAERAPQG